MVFFVSLSPNNFYTNNNKLFSLGSKAAEQEFRIKQKNPVVNEGNRIILTTVDKTGTNINSGVTWASGNQDVALVNPTTGEVTARKTGFATITARRGEETSSIFLVVARVRKANGAKVPGDTKTDSSGSIYISNPIQNVILKADNTLNARLTTYAGKEKIAGNRNGRLEESLFAGPTAIGVNNSANGGLYVADTLNHSIRKLGFNKQVETLIGSGSPGVSRFDNLGVSFDNILLNSPRGVVSDAGGNFYIADTDNHAIYYADMLKQRVFLLAGEPGQSGKDDGIGRVAKFKRPAGMALSNDGRLLSVADEENNRVRLIEISRDNNGVVVGTVSTLGANSLIQAANSLVEADKEFKFEQPKSVSIDGLGNIYVVDNTGVQLVTRAQGEEPQLIQLAQQDVSFNQAVSVTVKGTEAFVLDSGGIDEEALKVVSVGGPEIGTVEPATINLGETREIIVRGKSFAPESQVVVGGKLAQNVKVVSAEEIRFRFPAQDAPGKLTLSILTRGGLAQKPLDVVSKPASMLAIGEITTIAGGRVFNGDGGRAEQSNVNFPRKTVADSNGNLFIADSSSIRRIDAQTNVITTIAGGGSLLEDGVLANTSKISPVSLTVDKSGSIFVADNFTKRVRRIDSLTNVITTVAGKVGSKFSGDGGPATQAGFDNIEDLVFDSSGNLLVLESYRIRRIDAKGIITTIAGNGIDKFSGDNGPAKNAGFGDAVSIDVDTLGNIYIAEVFSNRVRRIDTNGIITTIVGNGKKAGLTRDGQISVKTDRDGKLATKISLIRPLSISVNADNQLFVSDLSQVAKSGGISFLVGAISRVDLKTGRINTQKIKLSNSDTLPADFSVSNKLTGDGLGNLFFGNFGFAYRFNIATGVATAIAGNTRVNFSEDDRTAQTTSLGSTLGVAFDSNNNLYLADIANKLVRKVDAATNVVTTIVGKDTSATNGNGDNGLAINAICTPLALAVDSKDNLLIADNKNFATQIRQVNLKTGIITTIAGNGSEKDSGDNAPAKQAGIGETFDLAIDSQDNIYFVTREGNLRKIDSKTNIITTVAKGFAGGIFSTVTVDRSDNILVTGNINLIRSVDSKTGKITDFAGNFNGSPGQITGDGGPLSQAGLGVVTEVAIDKKGNVFIASQGIQIPGSPLYVVRRVDAQTKIINTVAGNKDAAPDDKSYKGDGDIATKANLQGNSKIVVDKQDNLYIVINDELFNSIRLVKLSQ